MTLRDALVSSIVRGDVGAGLSDDLDDILDKLEDVAIDRLLFTAADSTRTFVGRVLTSSTPNTAEEKFVRRLIRNEDSAEDFWTAAAADTDIGSTNANAFRLRLETFGLVSNHLGAANGILGLGTPPATVRDLAFISDADWELAVTTYPADTPGADPAAKLANFIALCKANVESRLRTPWLQREFTDDADSGDVATLLAANTGFDIFQDRFDNYEENNTVNWSGLDEAETRTLIRRAERLARVTTRGADTLALMNAGPSEARWYGSAADVESRGMSRLVTVLGDEARAQEVYARACWASSSALALHTKYGARFHGPSMRSLPTLVHNTSAPLDDAVKDWAGLFGSADACKCEHCASVLGPSAYLVDLFQFLKKQVYEANTAFSVLINRRPDLQHIELHCKDAETRLPYLDLVNEILEMKVADGTPTGWPEDAEDNVETSGETDDLLAQPEVVRKNSLVTAYNTLATADYPFQVPYDFWADEARTYLAHLGVPRHDLIAVFGAAATRDAWSAAEWLNVSLGQRTILLDSDPSGSWEYWGLGSGTGYPANMELVLTFMRRANLTFDEVRELVATTWAQTEVSGVKFKLPDSFGCDLTPVELENVTAARLDFVHRFLRLQKALGWTISDLDKVFTASGAGTAIDAPLLLAVAGAERIRKELNQPLDQIAALFGPLDTQSAWAPSLYDRVYRAKATNQPATTAFDPGTLAATTQAILAHQATIVAALQSSDRNFALLTSDSFATAEIGQLAEFGAAAIVADTTKQYIRLAHLSRLYRLHAASRMLHLGLDELLIADAYGAHAGLTGPSSATPAAFLGFRETVEVVRSSAFSFREINYILRGIAPSSAGFAPNEEQLALWNEQVDAMALTAHSDGERVDDPTGDQLIKMLTELNPSGSWTALQATLEGVSTSHDDEEGEAFLMSAVGAYLEDAAAAKAAVVRHSTPNAAYLSSLSARYTYVAKRVARHVSAKGLVKRWGASTFSLELDVAELLVATPLLTIADADTRPIIWAFIPGPDHADSPSEDAAVRALLLQRLAKAALLLRKLAFSRAELEALYATDNGGLPAVSLDSLPADPLAPGDMTASIASFTKLVRMIRLAQLRNRYAAGRQALFALFAAAPGMPNVAAVVTQLEKETGWKKADVTAYLELFAVTVTVDDFANEVTLLLVEKAMKLLARVGASAAQAAVWSNLDADPPANGDALTAPPPGEALAIATDIKRTARAKYADAAWVEVSRPIRNVLRERQRDALVGYLLGQDVGNLADADELFERLLVDVQRGALETTSRIVQATGSVQTYVERILLGLESGITLSVDAARQWKWMKNYRVWEANRKVFLWPENWIEPELRDNKTPLFKTLEATLLQGELTNERAEDAFAAYLDQLDQVAHLEIVATHLETIPDETSISGGTAERLHVLGRTPTPSKYFHRTREDGIWSPWEAVDTPIQGDSVLMTAANGRPFIFWAQLDAVSVEGAAPNAETGFPPMELSIRVSYADKRRGAWSKVVTSEPLRAGALPHGENVRLDAATSGTNVIITASVYLHKKLVFQHNPMPQTSAKAWGRFATFTVTPCSPLLSARKLSDLAAALASKRHLATEVVLVDPDPDLRVSFPMAEKCATRFQTVAGNADGMLSVDVSGLQGRRKLFGNVPDAFELAIPHATTGSSWGQFFYSDPRYTFLIEEKQRRMKAAAKKQPELGTSNGFIDKLVVSLYPLFEVSAFSHPYVCEFKKALALRGVDGLLQWSEQRDSARLQLRSFTLSDRYTATAAVSPLPKASVDFSTTGAYSQYNWELFFHAPFLIATRLMQHLRFEEARKWFHTIFDPTDGTASGAANQLWKVKPFADNKDIDTILEDLTAESVNASAQEISAWSSQADDAAADAIEAQIALWRKDPFDPHAIAGLRHVAYQKAVFQKYIDNLLRWGDALFSQDTIESINEATQLYIAAHQLLGRRPESIDQPDPQPKTYHELVADGIDAFSNALVLAEASAPPPPRSTLNRCGARGPAPMSILGQLYFCVPQNEQLIGLWDVVADRLFKIRHSMNIEGVVRTLPLFQPPIDPALLVRAAAAGVDLTSVLSDLQTSLAPYRFGVLHAKAESYTSAVIGLGQSLLSALEKGDGEHLSNLRMTHELAIQEATIEIKRKSVEEAEANHDALQLQRVPVVIRNTFYQKSLDDGYSEGEETALAEGRAANELSSAADLMKIYSSVLHLIPNFEAGAISATTEFGGSYLGSMADAVAGSLEAISRQHGYIAQVASTRAGYSRREDDWKRERDASAAELKQLDQQILASEIRVAIAQHDLALAEKQQSQSREVASFMRDKFTSEQLYGWMAGQLSSVYFQSYKLAFEMARRAEKAFQHERGDSQSFVQFGYWDGLKQGLVAGEKLALDLRRMDAAYCVQNTRDRELLKSISLAKVNPDRLMRLIGTGSTTFGTPEYLFDRDHHDHYLRRIVSVATTVQCTTGPYQGVRATLRLGGSLTRLTPSKTTLDPRLAAVMETSTSEGQSDAGLFEVNLRDERLLPFEGAGVATTGTDGSEWSFSLSTGNEFDLESISDLIVHMRYVARPGRTAEVESGTPRHLLLRLRSEFEDAWEAFASGEEPSGITITVPRARFARPYAIAEPTITGARAYARYDSGDGLEIGGEVSDTLGTLLSFATIAPPSDLDDPWTIAIDDGTDDLDPAHRAKLLDVWVVIDYTADA